MYAHVTNLESELGPVKNGDLGVELAVGGTVAPTAYTGTYATHFWVAVKTKAVLVTFDGTDPATATQVGVQLAVGYEKVWSKRMVECARFIEQAGGQAGVVRLEPLAE